MGRPAYNFSAPQLILLDLKMPRINGAKFRQIQRQFPKPFADIPVVIVSGIEGAERQHAYGTLRGEAEQFQSVCAHLPAEIQPIVTFRYITGWRIGS